MFPAGPPPALISRAPVKCLGSRSHSCGAFAPRRRSTTTKECACCASIAQLRTKVKTLAWVLDTLLDFGSFSSSACSCLSFPHTTRSRIWQCLLRWRALLEPLCTSVCYRYLRRYWGVRVFWQLCHPSPVQFVAVEQFWRDRKQWVPTHARTNTRTHARTCARTHTRTLACTHRSHRRTHARTPEIVSTN